MAKEIPVYLFVGFLESGKTKFIQETFEDPNFDSGDKTLLLICEEGEEEYNPKKFAFPGVTVKVIEDKAEMNPQNLAKLEKESGAGRVVIDPSFPLLKGTQRQFLLDRKQIIETDISVENLSSYSRICLFNAMIPFGEITLGCEELDY